MSTVIQYAGVAAHYVLLALGVAIAALAVLAPATKSEVDNRVLAFLQKALGYVQKVVAFVLPSALHPAVSLPAEPSEPVDTV